MHDLLTYRSQSRSRLQIPQEACWRMPSNLAILLLWLSSPLVLAASSIRVNKSCFLSSENIVVSFNDATLLSDDWIAIFRSTDANDNLFNFKTWAWTCGSQSCTTSQGSGNVTFSNGLTTGLSYKAVLLRSGNNGNGPFTPLAVSSVFSIITSGQNCAQAAKAAASHIAVEQIRSSVRGMVARDVTLTAQLLRMIFHDCIDVCDGCIDLTNPDNAGLDIPINKLAPLVKQFANNATGLSRADVWAVAAVLGVDAANHGVHNSIFFSTNSIGRKDCEVANKACLDASGKQVHCGAMHGPHRNAPSMNLNTSGVFNYFKTHFNFSQRQSVAALGAHSVGSLHRQNSGIDGPDGWNINNKILHSEYYQALLGSTTTTSDSDKTKVLKSPKWKRTQQDNTNFSPKRPTRHMWHLFVQGKKLTMLDADIAIVRLLDNSNMNPTTGMVGCAYNPATVSSGSKVCLVASTIDIAAEFLDNDTWLSEFKSVLNLIVTNGYTEQNCGFKVCPLERKK